MKINKKISAFLDRGHQGIKRGEKQSYIYGNKQYLLYGLFKRIKADRKRFYRLGSDRPALFDTEHTWIQGE